MPYTLGGNYKVRGPHNIWRVIRVGSTFERTGAMKFLLKRLNVPFSLRIIARIIGLPFKPLGHRGDPLQPPLLRAITALGPAYIKFGQLLSTRPDIVGDEIASELLVLQDSLPAFKKKTAIDIIEAELGAKISETFVSLSEPKAAASLAQVHKAVLKSDGREVAVKVLRPGIEKAFLKDIDSFFFIARLSEVLAPSIRRLKPLKVIEHFKGIVLEELDLRMELAAAAEFKSNTENDDEFTVPSVLWELSTRRVMITEWVNGIPLSKRDELKKANTDLEELAKRIVQKFLTHALHDGFFHADMHQGNLMRGAKDSLIAMDFGIMGRIDPYTRRVYAEILMGFLNKDYFRVAEVHFEAGYVPIDQDVNVFAQSLRAVAEPIFGMEAHNISMARLLKHLFDVTERFGMETRTELLLLQRTMVVVEGVARSLDPNLNIWETAKPVVEDYIKENLGPKAILRDLSKTIYTLSRFGPHIPFFLEKSLRQILEPPPKKEKKRRLPALLGGITIGIVISTLSIGLGILWLQ